MHIHIQSVAVLAQAKSQHWLEGHGAQASPAALSSGQAAFKLHCKTGGYVVTGSVNAAEAGMSVFKLCMIHLMRMMTPAVITPVKRMMPSSYRRFLLRMMTPVTAGMPVVKRMMTPVTTVVKMMRMITPVMKMERMMTPVTAGMPVVKLKRMVTPLVKMKRIIMITPVVTPWG